MKKVTFIRLIDNQTIILHSVNQTNLFNGEIVYINGYRYKTVINQ